MNVKWLRRLKVMPTPTMTKDETFKSTDLHAVGKALMFTFPMAVKSVITRPSNCKFDLQGVGGCQTTPTGLRWLSS